MQEGIILQARINSTRLPNKITLNLIGNYSILDIILLRLKEHFPKIPIIIATGELSSNLELKKYADKYKVEFFVGEEEDVLQRFINCAEKFNIDLIVRICSDNPFLDMSYLSKLLFISNTIEADYYSFVFKNTPTIKTHFGLFTELIPLKSLKMVQTMTNEKIFHEHVTNFLYSNQDIFTCHFECLPIFFNDFEDVRLTVDTIKDFSIVQKIFEKLEEKEKIISFSYKDVFKVIKNNDYFLKAMLSNKLENSK